MKLRNGAPRGAVAMLVAVTAALGVAACGSSNNTSKKTTSTNASATTTTGASRAAFTACLKQHGVTLPKGRTGGFGPGGFGSGTGTNAAPPTGTTSHRRFPGGGFFGGGAAGRGFAGGNSKFAKALRACGSKLGSGAGFFGRGRFPGAGAAGQRTGRFHFAATALKAFVTCVRKNGYAAMPEPNASGRFPLSVEKNAKFQAASRKCVSILQSGIHAPGQSTTSTSSSAASA